jgi:hypothetical protein
MAHYPNGRGLALKTPPSLGSNPRCATILEVKMSMSKAARSIADELERMENQISMMEIHAEDLQVLTYRIASLLMKLALRKRL